MASRKKPDVPAPKEQDIQKAIIELLRLMGCFVWRQNQGGMKATYAGKNRFIRFSHIAGISDIIGVMPDGRFLAVEVKRPGKEPEEHQLRFLETIRSHGGVAGCVHSVEEAKTFLEAELRHGSS